MRTVDTNLGVLGRDPEQLLVPRRDRDLRRVPAVGNTNRGVGEQRRHRPALIDPPHRSEGERVAAAPRGVGRIEGAGVVDALRLPSGETGIGDSAPDANAARAVEQLDAEEAIETDPPFEDVGGKLAEVHGTRAVERLPDTDRIVVRTRGARGARTARPSHRAKPPGTRTEAGSPS